VLYVHAGYEDRNDGFFFNGGLGRITVVPRYC